MSNRIHHNKLVRDKIPDNLTRKRVSFDIRSARSSEMTGLLLDKLKEELEELRREELLSEDWCAELADVMEVVHTLRDRSSGAGVYIPFVEKYEALGELALKPLWPMLIEKIGLLAKSEVYGSEWALYLADIIAICQRFCQSSELSVTALQEQKREEIGGFSQGIVLLWTEESEK